MRGDDRTIRTTGSYSVSIKVELEHVNPAIWWLLGIVRPELLHDATWDGEAIR
jgi:hypothetical protein